MKNAGSSAKQFPLESFKLKLLTASLVMKNSWVSIQTFNLRDGQTFKKMKEADTRDGLLFRCTQKVFSRNSSQ